MDINYTEWLGYLASAIVLVSFLSKNVRTIRIINLVGCTTMTFYGSLLENGFPIVLLNSGIILIHLYHLFIKKNDE